MSMIAVGVVASAAPVAVRRFNSKVTLAPDDPFHGRVTSKEDGCEDDRVVKVFRVESGPDGLYGSTETDTHGKWSIPAGTPHGDFYAKVKRREEGAAGTTYVCRSDLSASKSFG